MIRLRWNILKEVTRKKPNVADQIMFKLVKPLLFLCVVFELTCSPPCYQVYPRLDIHVTKGLNHLLKVTFSTLVLCFIAHSLAEPFLRPSQDRSGLHSF